MDVLRRRHVPEPVQRRAVLRRLLAQLHLGDVPRRERDPEPGHPPAVRRGRGRAGGHPGRARRATSSTRTPTPARSSASTRSRTTMPRPPTRARTPTSGADPAARELQRHQLDAIPTTTRSPTHGTSTATVPTTTRPRRSPASTTPPAAPTRCACASPTRAACRAPTRSRSRAGTPPTATIATPTAGTTWRVDDVISFSGSATRGGGGAVPASDLSWSLVLNHCAALQPTSCHEHVVQNFTGASGSFTAPNHEYPAYLELKLTATDGGAHEHRHQAARPADRRPDLRDAARRPAAVGGQPRSRRARSRAP